MDFDYSRLRDHTVLKSLPQKIVSSGRKCLNLIWCDGENLLFWNAVEGCVEVISMKPVVRDGDLKISGKIYPNPRPPFDVEKVSSNGGGRVFALIGCQGVAGVRFPAKGNGFWEGRWEGMTVILGKGTAEVVSVKWHPGSPLDTHIAVLTRDECLRLYDASKGHLLWAIYLSRPSAPNILPNSKSLGDTSIDFIFAPPTLRKDFEETTWPVLLLWENGEIYMLETKLKESDDKVCIEGPLRVHPSVEDNYGCEASSIALLKSTPPILLLATSIGTIHHFLLIKDALFAVERVELETGLVLGEEPDISCPITLYPDPVDRGRYLTLSSAGVHVVVTPLPFLLEKGCPPHLLPPSDARHALCTSITTENHFSRKPLSALVHLDGDLYLATTSEGRIVELRVHSSQASEDFQIREEERNPTPKEELEVILKEAAHPPILDLPVESTQPREWLEVSLAMASRWRNGTRDVWKEAVERVEHRIASLRLSLEAQKETLTRLEAERPALRSSAELTAERLEEATNKGIALSSRTSALLLHLGHHSGLTSRAAANMEATLRNFTARSDLLKGELAHLCSAFEPFNEPIPNLFLVEKDIYLGEPKKEVIRKQLEYLTAEIHTLTKRIKELQMATNNLQNHRIIAQ